jgi:replicative DNA helicase
VPDVVFAQSAAGIGVFLRHLWATPGIAISSCDGFVCPIRLDSSSPELIRDVQSLLLRFGISAQRRTGLAGAHRLEITHCADLERYLSRIGSLMHQRSANGNAAEWVAVAEGAAYRAPVPTDPWHAAAAVPAASTATRELERPSTEIFGSEPTTDLGSHDVVWDEIVSIQPDGEDDVYDLTVEGLHSFVAEDIVVHNSLEQDADLVFFIYRDEYYNDETEAQGIAEVHLAKHRNGPTGTEKLAWLNRYAKFADLAAGG